MICLPLRIGKSFYMKIRNFLTLARREDESCVLSLGGVRQELRILNLKKNNLVCFALRVSPELVEKQVIKKRLLHITYHISQS
jgi:hypothetical protein